MAKKKKKELNPYDKVKLHFVVEYIYEEENARWKIDEKIRELKERFPDKVRNGWWRVHYYTTEEIKEEKTERKDKEWITKT